MSDSTMQGFVIGTTIVSLLWYIISRSQAKKQLKWLKEHDVYEYERRLKEKKGKITFNVRKSTIEQLLDGEITHEEYADDKLRSDIISESIEVAAEKLQEFEPRSLSHRWIEQRFFTDENRQDIFPVYTYGDRIICTFYGEGAKDDAEFFAGLDAKGLFAIFAGFSSIKKPLRILDEEQIQVLKEFLDQYKETSLNEWHSALLEDTAEVPEKPFVAFSPEFPGEQEFFKELNPGYFLKFVYFILESHNEAVARESIKLHESEEKVTDLLASLEIEEGYTVPNLRLM